MHSAPFSIANLVFTGILKVPKISHVQGSHRMKYEKAMPPN
jgi:hypothetical protein